MMLITPGFKHTYYYKLLIKILMIRIIKPLFYFLIHLKTWY